MSKGINRLQFGYWLIWFLCVARWFHLYLTLPHDTPPSAPGFVIACFAGLLLMAGVSFILIPHKIRPRMARYKRSGEYDFILLSLAAIGLWAGSFFVFSTACSLYIGIWGFFPAYFSDAEGLVSFVSLSLLWASLGNALCFYGTSPDKMPFSIASVFRVVLSGLFLCLSIAPVSPGW
jgi:hypothetical protein